MKAPRIVRALTARLTQPLQRASRLDALAAHLPDAIVELGFDGRLRYVSPNALPAFGADPAALLGTALRTLLHPDDRPHFDRVIGAAGPHAPLICRVLRSDGSLVRTEFAFRTVTDAAQVPTGIVAALRAISAAPGPATPGDVPALHGLATQPGQVGIWEWNLLTDTFRGDANLSALYGSDARPSAQSIVAWTATLHPQDVERVIAEMQRAVATVMPFDSEFRVRWPNGDVHHLRALATVICDAARRPLLLVGTNWDVTEVRVLAERLREEKQRLLETAKTLEVTAKFAQEASRAKTEFLARVSHEIRTPMNGIIGFTTLLLDSGVSRDQMQLLTYLKDSGESLLAVISDILNIAKIEAGKLELAFVPLCPRELVDSAISIVRADAHAKAIEITVDVSDDIPQWVRGDPTRLRQILLNLLTNALKFTDSGRVGLALRRGVDRNGTANLHFAVSDTGVGIPAASRHLLFTEFAQLEGRAAHARGPGLGLAICKRIVEAMGGRIDVESATGVGSTFWFEIALEVVNAPAGSAAPACVSPGRRILIVDDNAINQILVKNLLTRDGHDVALAANGQEAIAAVVSGAFDLVLMDMQMPVMDGVAATYVIRALDAPAGNVPVVALTANALPKEIARCMRAGMNAHLAKPIDRELLRAAIDTWTARAPVTATSENISDCGAASLVHALGDRPSETLPA